MQCLSRRNKETAERTNSELPVASAEVSLKQPGCQLPRATGSNSARWVVWPLSVRDTKFFSRLDSSELEFRVGGGLMRRHFSRSPQTLPFDPANLQRTASRKHLPLVGFTRWRTTAPSAIPVPGLNPSRGPVP